MTVVEHGHDSAPHNPTPAFAQPRLVLYVLLGGAIGSAGRGGLVLALPSDGGVPWAVLIANLCGSFLLGFLLTTLSRRPETPALRDARVFVGTGVIGGFTTYSSLATDTARLLEAQPLIGTAYAFGSVIAGVLLAFLGVVLAGALLRPDATTDGTS